jgi:UDP-N-acetylmuramoyl-L-alanyl-D-glutamate--2,6-diaminopimelate ligase
VSTSTIDIKKYSGISFDSREATAQNLFVAIKGENFNGEEFIDLVIEKGVLGVVLAKDAKVTEKAGVEYFYVDNPRKELSHLAAMIYPNQPKTIVGVTGTSGKTSTVGFYRQICEYNKIKSASIGTLGVVSNDLEFDAIDSMTSPSSVKLHSVLEELFKEKIKNVAIEVSSHGLDQYRLDGVNFIAAAFTNFTQDHLDYHKSFEAYLKAKLRLFDELLPSRSYAVLNHDINEFKILNEVSINKGLQVITYGKNDSDITFLRVGDSLNIKAFDKNFNVPFSLNAEFQEYNTICAVSLAVASGISIDHAIDSIPFLLPAIGRLEKIGEFNGAGIFIDYAHKPDALEKVLISARKFTSGKLHVLFGCGGDRDKSKRPVMGEIASRLADIIIITDDNPRTEDPSNIRRDILLGCNKAIEISGRRTAIKQAIANLKPSDNLIIAGKGHEDYQIIGEIKYRFSDAEEVKKILEAVTP